MMSMAQSTSVAADASCNTRLIMFIVNKFKNKVFNNVVLRHNATSPYNLQNYKKIFIYTLFKQQLRKNKIVQDRAGRYNAFLECILSN